MCGKIIIPVKSTAEFWSELVLWIIPSRSRPHNIKRLAAAFRETSATTPVLLWLDEDDPCLGGYVCPNNWELVVEPHMLLSEIYNEIYSRDLDWNLDWYGMLADDVVPETPGWDRTLVESAGKDGLAYGDDGIGTQATHFVLGSDLVRSVGWLALPGLDRLYIDTVWNDIAAERNVLRFLPHVKLRHHHFSNRFALMDETYKKHNKNRDKSIYEAWATEYHNREG